MWVFTVPSPRNSRPAISAFDSPPASSRRTSSSRSVSSASRRSSPGGAGRAGELLDQPARHRGRQQRLAGGHDADCVDELLGRRVLQEEAAGAGAQRLEDVVVLLEGRQDQHPRARRARPRPAGRLEPAAARHLDVHQHHVGPEAPGDLDGLLAVAGLARDLEVLLGSQDQLEAGPHQGLVVGQDDAHGHAPPPPGRSRAPRTRRRAARRRAARRRAAPPAPASRRARARRRRRSPGRAGRRSAPRSRAPPAGSAAAPSPWCRRSA